MSAGIGGDERMGRISYLYVTLLGMTVMFLTVAVA
jgi:hypothetical protein